MPVVVPCEAASGLYGCGNNLLDVIIDFSQFAGKTIILYNDCPAAIPAGDSRLDYYTDDVDQTSTGGTTSTLPGYGPDTRTIMEFHVSASGVPQPFNLAALQAEFTTTTDPVTGAVTHAGVFLRDQDPIIVPQAPYDSAYGTTSFPSDNSAYARIQDTSLTFSPLNLTTPAPADQVVPPVTIPFQSKAIQELFENTYGRMNATLGVELPFTNAGNQTTIPFGYIDPVTEILTNTPNTTATPIGSLADGTQLWKITHNGVDTHFIHFHLFNVQVINRVGWDGMVKPPDLNELGWKETVRMNPLEDVIIAMRPVAPKLPFGVPESWRLLDPTMPVGSTAGFSRVGPDGQPVTVTNQVTDFGWEYVWHCHILSHEEMDMMRPMQFNVATTAPGVPSLLLYSPVTGGINLFWVDPTPVNNPTTLGNPTNEIGFRIERADVDSQGNPILPYAQIDTVLANATIFTDTTMNPLLPYRYRVVAYDTNPGSQTPNTTPSSAVLTQPQQTVTAPDNLTAALVTGPQVSLTWMDNAGDATGFVVLSWTNNSINQTGFAIQRSTAAAFVNVTTFNVGAAVTTLRQTGLTTGRFYYYRIRAVNVYGQSVWVNLTPFPIMAR